MYTENFSTGVMDLFGEKTTTEVILSWSVKGNGIA